MRPINLQKRTLPIFSQCGPHASSITYSIKLFTSFSIQNINKETPTDPIFKGYSEEEHTPLGHTTDSHAFGEDTTFSDPLSGPSGVSAEKLFSPVINEVDSQEEPFVDLPQVNCTIAHL